MIQDNDQIFLSDGSPFINPALRTQGLRITGTGALRRNSSSYQLPENIGGYEVGPFLGAGAFGEVHAGAHQVSQEKVALKFLRKSEILRDLESLDLVNKEVQCLKALRHNNIIRLIHVSSQMNSVNENEFAS